MLKRHWLQLSVSILVMGLSLGASAQTSMSLSKAEICRNYLRSSSTPGLNSIDRLNHAVAVLNIGYGLNYPLKKQLVLRNILANIVKTQDAEALPTIGTLIYFACEPNTSDFDRNQARQQLDTLIRQRGPRS